MRRLAPFAALWLAACAGSQSALDPAADQAADTTVIWHLMLAVCGVMYLLVMLFLGWALWRARRALDGPPVASGVESPSERAMTRGLVGWTGLVVVGLLALAVASFLIDRRLALADEANAVSIKITGTQWWWKIEYQDPQAQSQLTTANELHLPAGRPARIELVADDVIHSFWVPNLAGKQDLIPGRINHLVLNPRRPGLYRGQCAEFCGLQHANMALDATVESPQAFEAWRQAQLRPAIPPSTPQQNHGLALFMSSGCAACHAINGTEAGGGTGPDLTHLASRRSIAAGARGNHDRDLVDWLHDPQAIKPGNHMPKVDMAENDLRDLVAYLDSLK